MQDNAGRGHPDFESTKTEISDMLTKEKQRATGALHDARDDITRKAGEYASEAKEALFEQADGAQQNISASMAAFGGAMRAASEHLANSDQREASKFVREAAGGIERLSSSLQNKPFEEVLGEIRSFGRQNGGALIAGSVLAGLALGRVIKSASQNGVESGDSGYTPEEDDGLPVDGPEAFGTEFGAMEKTDE